ncbi:MAG: hypothetical protein QXO69_03440 [archaeon]
MPDNKKTRRKTNREIRIAPVFEKYGEYQGIFKALLKEPTFQRILFEKGAAEADKAAASFISAIKGKKVGFEAVQTARSGKFHNGTQIMPPLKSIRKTRMKLLADEITREYKQIKKQNSKITKQEAARIIGEKHGFSSDYVQKLIKTKEKKQEFTESEREKMIETKQTRSFTNMGEARGLLSAFKKVPETAKIRKEKGIQALDEQVAFAMGVSKKTIKSYRLGKIDKQQILKPTEKGLDFAGKKALAEREKRKQKNLLNYLWQTNRGEYMTLKYGSEEEKKAIRRRYPGYY